MLTVTFDAGVATLMLSRPPVNAMDRAFVTKFESALDRIVAAKPVLVVLRSDQKCFCAGADLAMIRGFFGHDAGVVQMLDYVRSLHHIFNRLEMLEAVTLAAIEGAALGGGLEMALACDLRLVAASAKIGLPEARVGQIPGAGGTQRLARLAGLGVANRLILGAEVIDGREAERLGIAQWCATPETFEDTLAGIVARIASLSRDALVTAKACIRAGLDPARDGYAMECEAPLSLMRSDTAKAFVDRFFDTRKP